MRGGACTFQYDKGSCAKPEGVLEHQGMTAVYENYPKPLPTELPIEVQGEAVIAFAAYSEAVLELVRRKDAAYQGAWQKQGYMGNLARIMSKTERLKAMLWREQPWLGTGGEESDQEMESVLDTLKDLMALAAFCAANIEDGNRWGK
jgi:hypothetical protein